MNRSRLDDLARDTVLQREEEARLARDGMPLKEALRLLAEVHTADDDATGFNVRIGVVPDFPKIGPHRYRAAWAAVRKAAGMATNEKGPGS